MLFLCFVKKEQSPSFETDFTATPGPGLQVLISVSVASDFFRKVIVLETTKLARLGV